MAAFREGTGIDFTNATETMLAGNAAMDNPSTRWTSSGVESVEGALNDFGNRLDAIAAENSALSQSYAEKQMRFQRESQLMNMRFNASEAAKSRAWQDYMSSTAHRREVNDLLLAGLNPVLSATGGNGAAVGSGATASNTGTATGSKGDVDMSYNNAVVSLLGSMLNNQTELANAALTANNNMAISQLTNETNKAMNELTNFTNDIMNSRTNEYNKYIALKYMENAIDVAHISGMYGNNAAAISAGGVMAAAAASAGATRYAADKNAWAAMYGSDRSYESARDNPNTDVGVTRRYWEQLKEKLYGLGKDLGWTRFAPDVEEMKNKLDNFGDSRYRGSSKRLY